MAKNAGEARKRRAKADSAEKGHVLREVEIEVPSRRRARVSLPLVRSKQPGTVALDNARISEIIPFP